jgi:hypothetical protein
VASLAHRRRRRTGAWPCRRNRVGASGRAHHQFRRRRGQHRREPVRLRQQPRFLRLRAQHQPLHQLFADRRPRRRHAARLLVHHRPECRRAGGGGQRGQARGRARARAPGSEAGAYRRIPGAVRARRWRAA